MTNADIWIKDDWDVGDTGHATIHNLLAQRMNYIHYVTDPQYNAKGDNATDDTGAIQAALDDGGIVVIPPGTYLIDTLNIPSQTHVIGAGKDTVLKHAGTGSPIKLTNTQQVRIQGIYVNAENTDTVHGFDLNGSYDTVLDHVYFYGEHQNTGSAIYCHNDTYFLQIIGGQYIAAGQHGFRMENGCAAVLVQGARFQWAAQSGFYSPSGGKEMTFQATVFEGNIEGQFIAGDFLSSSIFNCHFEESVGSTNIPMIIGGGTKGLSILNSNFNADEAEYSIKFTTPGSAFGVSVNNNRFRALNPTQGGSAIAAIRIDALRWSEIKHNEVYLWDLPDYTYPLLDYTGGYVTSVEIADPVMGRLVIDNT